MPVPTPSGYPTELNRAAVSEPNTGLAHLLHAAFAIGLTTTRAEFLPRVDDTTYMSPKPSRSICLSMLCQFVASPTKKRVSFASNRWRNSASVIGVMQVRVMELPIFLEILRNASANRLAPNAPPMVVMKLSQNRNN